MCLFHTEKEWKSLRYDSKNSHNHQSQYSVHNRIKISAWTESNQWRQIWRFYKLIPLVAVEFPQTPCTLYTASNGKLIEFLLICWNVRYFSYTCKTLCCSSINDGTLTEGGTINNTLKVAPKWARENSLEMAVIWSRDSWQVDVTYSEMRQNMSRLTVWQACKIMDNIIHRWKQNCSLALTATFSPLW